MSVWLHTWSHHAKNDVSITQIEEEPEEPAEDDAEDKEEDSEDKEESVDEEDDEETVRPVRIDVPEYLSFLMLPRCNLPFIPFQTTPDKDEL